MDGLLMLSPREFEELVADFLRADGFAEVQRVGGAGDLGVDIRCKDEFGRLVVVQCKKYQTRAKIGSPEIQHFFGMIVHAGAARGIFVTTSDYTAPARELALNRDIELIDGFQVANYFTQMQRQQQAEIERRRLAAQARTLETRNRQAASARIIPSSGTELQESARNPSKISNYHSFGTSRREPKPQSSTRPSPREIERALNARRYLLASFSLTIMYALVMGNRLSNRGVGFWYLGITIVVVLGYGVASNLWAVHHGSTGRTVVDEFGPIAFHSAAIVWAFITSSYSRHRPLVGILTIGLVLIIVVYYRLFQKQWDRDQYGEYEFPNWINSLEVASILLSLGGLVFLINYVLNILDSWTTPGLIGPTFALICSYAE